MSDESTPQRTRTLGTASEAPPPAPPGSEERSDGWKTLVERLRRGIRRWRLQPGALEPGRWWNGSLRSGSQLETAAERARAARLPAVERPERVWDSLEALELIVGAVDRSARIVDIGLRTWGPLVSWLSLLGYGRFPPDESVRLRANRRLAGHRGGIEDAGDLPLGHEGRFDVVTCRTLPGDRVPLSDRLRQSRLLLRPGGYFVLATEFWDLPEPYENGTRRCASDHLCCRRSTRRLARKALEMGLVPVAPIFLDRPPEQRHPDLLGVGMSPVKLAFRKRGDLESVQVSAP